MTSIIAHISQSPKHTDHAKLVLFCLPHSRQKKRSLELDADIEKWNEGKENYEEVIYQNEFAVVKDEHL